MLRFELVMAYCFGDLTIFTCADHPYWSHSGFAYDTASSVHVNLEAQILALHLTEVEGDSTYLGLASVVQVMIGFRPGLELVLIKCKGRLTCPYPCAFEIR